MKKIAVLLLAAGKGVRMGEGVPKVLRKIQGKSIISWDIELIREMMIKDVYVVVSQNYNQIESEIADITDNVKFISQDKQQGTGHAVAQALQQITEDYENVLVLFADDAALYKPNTILNLIDRQVHSDSPFTVLTMLQNISNPIGGLKKDESGNLIGVLTKKEIDDQHLQQIEIVCGVFCFNGEWLKTHISSIVPSSISGEYPLPALIAMAAQENKHAKSYILADNLEWNSVNTPEELEIADQKKHKQIYG